jgi:hypothetical protein
VLWSVRAGKGLIYAKSIITTWEKYKRWMQLHPFLYAKTAVYAHGSKSVLVKTTRHEKLRITVVPSVLADGS